MTAIIVIPARYASTRFPGKALAMIRGRTLIRRVCDRATLVRGADGVFVATDDERIASEVASFGGRAIMTASDVPSGTDRIARALAEIDGTFGGRVETVVNLQGDEPLIDVDAVERMIGRLAGAERLVVTLSCPIESNDELEDPNVVKVVTDLEGRALYFSRSPIPHGSRNLARRHVGIYGFSRDALDAFERLEPSPLERAEKLEQLRLLQNGYTIQVLETSRPQLGVDRPEDVEKVERALDSQS